MALSSGSGSSKWRYVPGAIVNAVENQGDYTDNFSGQGSALNKQASRFNSHANYLTGLSRNYNATSGAINDVALSNLLKYGEVSENDLVGKATTDNTLAYSKSWDAARRNLTRMGINPNSGRFAGANQDFALMRAAAEAGARNQARIQARNENYARANRMAGLGYNYAGLGLNAANSATSAMNSATSAMNSATNAFNTAAANADRYASNIGSVAALNNSGADRAAIARYGGGNLISGVARIKNDYGVDASNLFNTGGK